MDTDGDGEWLDCRPFASSAWRDDDPRVPGRARRVQDREPRDGAGTDRQLQMVGVRAKLVVRSAVDSSRRLSGDAPRGDGVRILRRLLPSQDIDALLGDITEEAPHRSHLWLWGQIAAVIVVGSFRDIRRHPLLALRAVAVGIAVLAVGALMFEPIIRTSLRLSDLVENAWFRSVDRTLLERLNNTAFLVSVTALFYGGLAASGWVVGRLHRRHGITM